jgi:ADP-heptose:LPS heptosyltransferase
MTKFFKLLRSIWGLFALFARGMMRATGSLSRRDSTAAANHVRFALLALHDDLATLAALLKNTGRLPPAEMIDRILIVKLDRVGDMVNTTPVFDFLHKLYPGAKLDVVGHPAVLTLLEDDNRILTRIPYQSALYHPTRLRPPSLSQLRVLAKLLRAHYSLVVYLRGSFPFLLLSIRSHFVATKFIEGEPVIQRYMKPLGANYGPGAQHPIPSLHVAEKCREKVLAKYPNLATRSSVVIHAASTDEGRQWPIERFAHIADELHTISGAEILFLGTPAERKKLDQVAALCGYSHHFETDLRLPEAVALIALADVFIGNDSGLAHIAAATHTREVIIWGGANLQMSHPTAAPGRCTVLYQEIDCRTGCPEVQCNAKEHLKCLRSITEASVIAETLKHLSAATEERHSRQYATS